ncbi:bifunctional protein GlmU [Litorimonas cladophorae]|uniref:Bifunctional protein GlmU n=1 Tax=Litorimonas cladophorae TaxID=1220491 RepID=A0A918NBF2_9PROT|nr:bifunctional UDP-N-acetylglucosamine diphosphorylase/glucosamine-1-phosphate N-acetyltransferase GlmU [Litorimonas cladophorae]GGX60196.1 bifunctional protein GlmU [Litorimonas cladophorae]
MTTKRAAIILAAGKSTRMKSSRSKVLHPIGGRPMIEWVTNLAKGAGIERIVCVVGEDNADVRAAAEGLGLDIAVQEPQMGTGHAVQCAKAALDNFDGQVVVLYADTPLISGKTLNRVFEAFETHALAVLGFEAADPAAYGRLVTQGADLHAIVEAKECTAEQLKISLCNSGVVAASAADLFSACDRVTNDNKKGEYYLTDIVEILRGDNKGATVVHASEAEVLGVNDRRDLANAEAAFQAVMREAAMVSGVSLKHPETVYFAYDTILEPDVTVEANVVFGPGVTVRRGATIHAFSHLEGADVGEGASVGPFARLRAGTVLAENAKVGNFVETKKASIGRGSKINHLSYVGDAELGDNVNIGAGTITCNYDGYKKHKTTIGDGAFIGSNSSLVAPVTIGAGAFLGSGGVVTKDVPDDALALARADQVNKLGWGARFRAVQEKLKAKKS